MSNDRAIAWMGALVVGVHALVNAAHGVAHAKLEVALSRWQEAFVVVVIGLSPVIAAVLLWTRHRRIGVFILTGSMAAAFAFGLHYHYLAVSPDHVDHLPPGEAQGLFRATALLVAASQGLGVLVGLWSWRRCK